MSDCGLNEKKCVPCEGGVPALGPSEIETLLKQLNNWQVSENKKISRKFEFADFVGAMAFVNKVADLAEQEGHHPDIFVHYNQVEIILWTHAIGGLSENDFIVASKTDGLV